MKTLLRKGGCLALFLALSGAALPASQPHHESLFTTAPFWTEDFSLPDGSTADAGSTAWTSSVTYSKAIFRVEGGAFEVNNSSINGPGTWTSAPISIAGKNNIVLSAAVRSQGGLENDATPHADYIRFYYQVDGGAEVLFADLNGIIDNNSAAGITVSTTGAISGSTVQIIVRAKATATDEYYFFDNVTAAGDNACTGDAIPAGVSAFASDKLTCNVTSVALSGASSTPGVTYSWTGPGNFAAAAAGTSTATPGAYAFTVTNPANGCSKTIPVIVSQDIAPPAGVTAICSGTLTCSVTEVTLTGSSTSPNVEYEWDGPDGYLSFSAQDIATEAGDYVLTVTNDDNGCTIKASVTVLFDCPSGRKTTSPATK